MQSTFMVNTARFPWAQDTAPVWRPLPRAACMRLEAVVHAMTEPGYDGPLTVMVPLPLVVRAPVEIPRSYFVVVRQCGARAIQLNQFKVEIRHNVGRRYSKRPIMTHAHILRRYPHITFLHRTIEDYRLQETLFWDVLTDQCKRISYSISLRSPQVRPALTVADTVSNHAQIVLQAGVMQPGPVFTSLMIPNEIDPHCFMVVSRIDHTVVRAVSVNVFSAQGTLTQVRPIIADDLEHIYPGWRFPYIRLTAHELFTHMQLPVRRHYTRQIRKYFAPHLRMLKRALLPSAADRGCALGRLSPELMARITALVVEEWGYE